MVHDSGVRHCHCFQNQLFLTLSPFPNGRLGERCDPWFLGRPQGPGPLRGPGCAGELLPPPGPGRDPPLPSAFTLEPARCRLPRLWERGAWLTPSPRGRASSIFEVVITGEAVWGQWLSLRLPQTRGKKKELLLLPPRWDHSSAALVLRLFPLAETEGFGKIVYSVSTSFKIFSLPPTIAFSFRVLSSLLPLYLNL